MIVDPTYLSKAPSITARTFLGREALISPRFARASWVKRYSLPTSRKGWLNTGTSCFKRNRMSASWSKARSRATSRSVVLSEIDWIAVECPSEKRLPSVTRVLRSEVRPTTQRFGSAGCHLRTECEHSVDALIQGCLPSAGPTPFRPHPQSEHFPRRPCYAVWSSRRRVIVMEFLNPSF